MSAPLIRGDSGSTLCYFRYKHKMSEEEEPTWITGTWCGQDQPLTPLILQHLILRDGLMHTTKVGKLRRKNTHLSTTSTQVTKIDFQKQFIQKVRSQQMEQKKRKWLLHK